MISNSTETSNSVIVSPVPDHIEGSVLKTRSNSISQTHSENNSNIFLSATSSGLSLQCHVFRALRYLFSVERNRKFFKHLCKWLAICVWYFEEGGMVL